MGLDYAARTHVGLRRKLNEDAVLACAERGLWAVADGMGGHEAGEVASAMIIDALSSFESNGALDSRSAAAVAALEGVNARLRDLAASLSDERTIGSTIVGLLTDSSAYTCFWVGDSRAYCARNGNIVQLTHDHSLVQELVDAGMLSAEEAAEHPNSNIITRAVGAESILRTDRVTGELQAGDVFLLASDGLTRLVGDEELLAKLVGRDLQATADDLIAMALERGGHDNISLVIVRVQ